MRVLDCGQMSDFPPTWKHIRDLPEGGQAHTFIVQSTDGLDPTEYVLKRLKNLDRATRFEQEIKVCQTLQHPNILRIFDSGTTPKRKPYLVTEYCSRGRLTDQPRPFGTVLQVLETFRAICAGAAHAQNNNIVHRDIKPDNIFFRNDGTPVLGDFGICFIDDGTRLTLTEEVAGSRWYCAPELRDGRLQQGISQNAADVYSLGKLLYWMLSEGRMFDREQHRKQEYLLGQYDLGASEYQLVNQLLDAAIVEDPEQRILGAPQLLGRVDGLIKVIRAGGHPITLAVQHRCLFCGVGHYVVTVDGTKPGELHNRSHRERSIDNASSGFGWKATAGSPTWLIFVCDTCGHVQTFRPDLAPASLRNWNR
jgi:serine/threonine protein kinase